MCVWVILVGWVGGRRDGGPRARASHCHCHHLYPLPPITPSSTTNALPRPTPFTHHRAKIRLYSTHPSLSTPYVSMMASRLNMGMARWNHRATLSLVAWRRRESEQRGSHPWSVGCFGGWGGCWWVGVYIHENERTGENGARYRTHSGCSLSYTHTRHTHESTVPFQRTVVALADDGHLVHHPPDHVTLQPDADFARVRDLCVTCVYVGGWMAKKRSISIGGEGGVSIFPGGEGRGRRRCLVVSPLLLAW